MKRAAVLALALLASCNTPPIKERVVEVSKPVAIRPITAAQVPVMPKPLPPRPSSLSAAADLLLGKVCEWVAYGLRADPLLKTSAGQQPVASGEYPECKRAGH